VGAALVAIVVVVVVLIRRRSGGSAPSADAPPSSGVHDEPMTGLEAALAQVTDRQGRPIGEAIDAEAEVVDELRVPDDTGPLLRRALDRVEHDDAADDGDEDHPPDASEEG